MIKFEVRNRFNGAVQFTAEIERALEDIRECAATQRTTEGA